MNQINWKKILTTVAVVIVLVVIGFLAWYLVSVSGGVKIENLKKIPVPESEKKTDQKTDQKIKENIAVPKETVKAGPKTESKLRIFEIKGENGLISPSDFRAYQNDIVNIKLTAVDQDYDLRLEGYNIEVKAKKGETKTIEFQALNPGIFNFYCSLCSISNKPVAKLTVVPK